MNETIIKTLIDAVCAVTTDRWTLEVAEWATMKPGGRAAEFLNHYLSGSGTDIPVDISTLLREDAGVLMTVEREISSQINRPMCPTFVVPLPQRVFTNPDWQYATGSINMHWKRLPMLVSSDRVTVELSFRNQYRWHPKERRISQCVHQAAEDLKQRGARDYWITGRATSFTFRPI